MQQHRQRHGAGTLARRKNQLDALTEKRARNQSRTRGAMHEHLSREDWGLQVRLRIELRCPECGDRHAACGHVLPGDRLSLPVWDEGLAARRNRRPASSSPPRGAESMPPQSALDGDVVDGELALFLPNDEHNARWGDGFSYRPEGWSNAKDRGALRDDDDASEWMILKERARFVLRQPHRWILRALEEPDHPLTKILVADKLVLDGNLGGMLLQRAEEILGRDTDNTRMQKRRRALTDRGLFDRLERIERRHLDVVVEMRDEQKYQTELLERILLNQLDAQDVDSLVNVG